MCPLANQLFLAVLTRYESPLAAGTARDSFFRRRDKILEQEVELHFRSLSDRLACSSPLSSKRPISSMSMTSSFGSVGPLLKPSLMLGAISAGTRRDSWTFSANG